MKKRYIVVMLMLSLITSCSNYLDVRPDKALAVPDKLQDLQALLDYENIFNMQYPAAGDIAADYYYINEADWMSRNVDVRNTYVWNVDAQNHLDWSYAFQRIFHCNVVLDEIDDANLGSMDESDRMEIKGRALFFRGWNYFQLAQLYAPYYAIGMEDSELGLPLKLKSDINETVYRTTLSQTYAQIFDDLLGAAELLPDQVPIPTRPSRIAALAALSKLHLLIGDYHNAAVYADSCLQIDDTLMDYNTLDKDAALPIKVFNPEVVFHTVILATSGVHAQSRAFVDTTLVSEYQKGDLRKSIFLKPEETGSFRFKGSYEGGTLALFGGLALDEIYLVKAESLARIGKEQDAINVLNKFLKTRWDKELFEPLKDIGGEQLLSTILKERRKQLLFRGGIRWADIRRLNQDPRFSKILRRTMAGETHELKPDDKRFTFLIPIDVIEMSGIIQNPR